MKKRVLSVLLVIALLVAVGIVAAQANESDPTPAKIKEEGDRIVTTANAMTFTEGKIPTTCPKCGDNIEWQELNRDNFTEGARTGHWYLSSDITVEDTTKDPALISASGTLCLHLNGHSISASTKSFNGHCLNASTGNTLNLYGTGSVNGLGATPAMWVPGGTANIYGGDFNAVNSYACIEMRQNGTLNFFGGSQSTGQIRYAAANTAVNIYGGSVRANSATGVGNIATCKTNIYGGTVTTAAAYGSALTVTGGNITTLNSCAPAHTGGITISGNPKITTLTLRSDFMKPTFGALTPGASIGFGNYTDVISTAYNTPGEAEAIAATFPAIPGKTVTVNDAKELVLQDKTYTEAEIVTESKKQSFGDQAVTVNAFCYACGKMTDWKPLTSAATSVSGHYFLPADLITTTEGGFTANTGDLCLHLNGKTIGGQTRDVTHRGISIRGNYEYNLMGDGTVQNAAINWTALDVQDVPTAEVNIYGGNFVNHYGSGSNNNTIGAKAGVVNIYDATILDTPTGAPGKLLVASGGTANVYGGTMVIQTKDKDANKLYVYDGTFGFIDAMSGEVYISGGTITKLTGKDTVRKIQISGDPTISDLDLSASPVKLTIGTLTSGASITVGAAGDITENFASPEDAEAAKTYFTVPSGFTLSVSGSKLTCTAVEIDGAEDIIDFVKNDMSQVAGFAGSATFKTFCPHCRKAVDWTAITNSNGVQPNAANGHYFLAEDTITRTLSAGSATGVVLYLNAKTMNVSDVWYTLTPGSGELTILGDGNVTNSFSSYSAVFNSRTGTVNIYGGTYTNRSTAGNSVVFDMQPNAGVTATVNLYGGTIGTSSARGAMMSKKSVFNMYGGVLNGKDFWMNDTGEGYDYPSFYLYGGTVKTGGPKGNYGKIYLYGGVIESSAGDITMGGPRANCTYLYLGATSIAPEIKIQNATDEGAANVIIEKEFTGKVNMRLNAEKTENGTFYGQPALYVTALEGLNGAIYASDVDANVYGLVYDTTADDGSLVVARTAIVNGETTSWYENNEQAVTAYDGNGYIKLTVDDQLTLTKDITVDLCGLLVKVYGEGTLTGFDTKTKGNYDVTPGAIEIDNSANITTAAPKTQTAADGTVSGYLPVAYDGVTSFSYFEMKLSGIALKANKDTVGLYYKGTWSFNKNLAAEANVTAGVVVNAEDAKNNNEEPINIGFRSNPANGYSELNAANIANGKPVTSLLIKDIMLATNEAAKNSKHGQIKIKAAAYVTVNGVDFDVTGTKNMSVQDVLKMFEEPGREETYNDQKTKLAGFYNDWVTKANLDTWGLTKIGQSVES